MRKRNSGQNMVEFALVLPLLLAVLFGIIDGAFLMQGYLAVNHAAREAARFAITYQPDQGTCLRGNTAQPWPYCPAPGYGENPYESDADYHARRAQLIKDRAVEAANGLRTETVCNGEIIPSSTCIQNYLEESGMLGVQLWGLPSFEDLPEEDHPGLQGLTVRVRVVHNVPLVIFAPFLPHPYVRVSSSVEMINEGVQVGYGNLAPPTIGLPIDDPIVDPQQTVTPLPTVTEGPTPTPTPLPVYNLNLDFTVATNELPEDRDHNFAAIVTNPQGDPIAGARVTFFTDEGSFSYSGTGMQYDEAWSGADGRAEATIYANEPTTATITAWLDYNGNGVVDPEEPSDTATKIWEATGPYLVVSDHNPAPADWIGVDLWDHPPSGNPHSIWWCPSDAESAPITRRLAYPVDVDGATWDTPITIPVEVPLGVSGRYRIESHAGDGGTNACGAGTRVAYSAVIEVAEVPPDLIIADMRILNTPTELLSGYPVTVVVEVENISPVAISGIPFDIDLYLNLDDPPASRQLGDAKQWLADLGPLESIELTMILDHVPFGSNNLWAQVDTTNYIDEGTSGGEDNNVFGPLEFVVDCGIPDSNMSDSFDSGLGGQWTTAGIGGANGSYNINGGRLEISSNGPTLWGGDNRFYYIYQGIEGDFDARLRVIDRSQPNTSNWAKVGLHLRQYAEDTRSPYVMNMITRDRNPAGTQAAYRPYYNNGENRADSDRTIGLPNWVRLVRQGNTYTYYYSTAADPGPGDWILQGTHTAPNSLDYIGIAHASYNSSNYGTAILDDFMICTEAQNTPRIFPPGLKECTELLRIPSFEGNSATVLEYWKAGDYARTSRHVYHGAFAMRLHASLAGDGTSCTTLQPYLYQDVVLPSETYSISTLIVDGQYRITKSEMDCSPGGPDADDVLYLRVQDTAGSDITPPQAVTHGGAPPNQWHHLATDLSAFIDLENYANANLRLYWNGTHDEDYNGTYFYMDQMSAQLCTEWPIPDDIPDTASFGGLLTTLGEYHAPVILPGAKVWAYSQGGQVYQTLSIHDGTYHFYNIPPDTYVVYSEAWVSGNLRTATTTLTVEANERNYNVNLLLN